MTTKLPRVSPEASRFINRMHEDASFRCAFELEPLRCVEEYALSDEEKRLFSSREQNDWFSVAYGYDRFDPNTLLATVKVKVVVVSLVKQLENEIIEELEREYEAAKS